jgi:hypothetical protein
MLLLISLFRLEPQISFEEYDRFERSVIQRYTDFYLQQGVAYLGQFHPLRMHEYNCAEIHLVDTQTLEEGQRMVVMPPNAPEDIMAIESVRRSLHVPNMRMNIWLKPIELSPLALNPLDIRGRLLRFYFYVPDAMRSLEEFRRFECRIQSAYAQFMRAIDWHYLGAYQAAGLLEPMYTGFDLVRAETPEEAIARDEAYPVTPEIAEILAESRSFRQPGREMVTLWLKPAVLSSFAETGFSLSGVDRPPRPVDPG